MIVFLFGSFLGYLIIGNKIKRNFFILVRMLIYYVFIYWGLNGVNDILKK